MPNLTFKIYPFTATKKGRFNIQLDCWRATLYLIPANLATTTGVLNRIDGAPVPNLAVIPGVRSITTWPIVIGGAYDCNGKPINIKHDIVFDVESAIMNAWLVQEYITD